MNERKLRPWPLLLMALPAAVAIWSGWVGLGELAGFGLVQPLPGILRFHLNTAITLPVGVEAYGAYALGAWLRPGTPDAARKFARWSAIGALGLGMLGQVAYHMLAAFHVTRAPVFVIVPVACIPVVALGFGAGLAHLLRAGGEASSEQAPKHELATFAAPLVSALAARISPVRDTVQGTPEGTVRDTAEGSAGDSPEGTVQDTAEDSAGLTVRDIAQAVARVPKQSATDRSDWPSARPIPREDLLRRTRSAVTRWEKSHEPGERLPAIQLPDLLKLRMSRTTATSLLAEVYKPHLVKSVDAS